MEMNCYSQTAQARSSGDWAGVDAVCYTMLPNLPENVPTPVYRIGAYYYE